MNTSIKKRKVMIVGAGTVGSTTAHALLPDTNLYSEILLVDIDQESLAAQVTDLQNASQAIAGVPISSSSYDALDDDDIVVITAGKATHGEISRLNLTQINAEIIAAIVSEINKTGKTVFILIVTNPVDVLTYVAYKASKLPQARVFGSGTLLDSTRLICNLAEQLDLETRDIQAQILGEHGDSSFIDSGSIKIKGESWQLSQEMREKLTNDVRTTAYKIIKGKGATNFGIASATREILHALVCDTGKVMPLSVIVGSSEHYNISEIAMGLPAVITSHGVKLAETTLNDEEQKLLTTSAELIKKQIKLATTVLC